MSIYFAPQLASYAQLPNLSSKFYNSLELKKLQALAKTLDLVCEYTSLDDREIIYFGKKLGWSEAYYEGMIVPLREFSQYQATREDIEMVSDKLIIFKELINQSDLPETLKNLKWTDVSVFFYTHT